MAHKFPIEMKSKLDSPERKRLFNPTKALSALGIGRQMVVADIGCGTGFFTVPLARLAGQRGRVLAIDISRQMLRDARMRIKKEGLHNVRLILSRENKIPVKTKSIDYCLLVSVVHELDDKVLFFSELKRLLKEGGRIGIIEWKKIPSSLGPPLKERIPAATMRQMLVKNGYRIEKAVGFGKYNYGLVARDARAGI